MLFSPNSEILPSGDKQWRKMIADGVGRAQQCGSGVLGGKILNENALFSYNSRAMLSNRNTILLEIE